MLVKKLREENDQLKKEAANAHALKKTVKNPAISVVPDAVKEASPLSSPIVPIVPKTSAELPTLASTDMHLQSRKHQATTDDTCTSAELPIEPQSEKAKELADEIWHAAEDAVTKSVPKELIK